MRCLYCGKQLALFRRLTGSGEFCSDAHKSSYHEEYNRLALSRLMQAQVKADELRAQPRKAPVALAKTGTEDSAPAVSMRSNAHWTESRPAERVRPKVEEMARPAERDRVERDRVERRTEERRTEDRRTEERRTEEWALGAPTEGGFFPSIASNPFNIPHLSNEVPSEALPFAVQVEKPVWNPAWAAQAAEPAPDFEIPVPEALPQALPPACDQRQPQTQFNQPGPLLKALEPVVPAYPVKAPTTPTYRSMPAIEINPLSFAPVIEARCKFYSDFEPLGFEVIPYDCPDFDILISESSSAEMREPVLAVVKAEPVVTMASDNDLAAFKALNEAAAPDAEVLVIGAAEAAVTVREAGVRSTPGVPPAQPAKLSKEPKARTVRMPSILDESQKEPKQGESVWGTLRKYFTK